MSEPLRPQSTPTDEAARAMEQRGEARRRLRRRLSVVGCGCFIILLVLGIGGGLVIYKGAKNLASDFADPEQRTQKVLAHLGAEALPPGYHAVLSLDVPLPFHMVVLSDQPWVIDQPEDADSLPIFTGLPGDKLFFYIHIMTADRSGQDPFEREFKSSGVLDRGDLRVHGRLVAWEAHRGGFRRPEGETLGVFARLRMECEDQQTRRAVWFVADEQSTDEPSRDEQSTDEQSTDEQSTDEQSTDEQSTDELTGTPADSAAVVELLSHFNVCQAEEDLP